MQDIQQQIRAYMAKGWLTEDDFKVGLLKSTSQLDSTRAPNSE